MDKNQEYTDTFNQFVKEAKPYTVSPELLKNLHYYETALHRLAEIACNRDRVIQQVRQDMLTASLGEFKDYGFLLTAVGDQTTELTYKGRVIARYNLDRLTIPILQEGCRNYLKNIGREGY